VVFFFRFVIAVTWRLLSWDNALEEVEQKERGVFANHALGMTKIAILTIDILAWSYTWRSAKR